MTVSDLGDVADNIDQMNKFHENLPQWLENPDLPGYNKSRLLAEVATFKEYSQVWGSRYGPCRDLMSDNWLRHITERIEAAKVNHNNSSRRNTLVMFATHTEVILSTMQRMDFQIERIETSGGFVAEIRFTENEGERVRFFELVPDGDGHTISKANIVNKSQCDNEWMSRYRKLAGWIP